MTRQSVVGSIFLSLIACVGSASLVHADGMRCGSKLVSDGDSLLEVSERCGPPDYAAQHIEYRTVRSYIEGPCYRENGVLRCGQVIEQTIQIIVDEWKYDFGPDRLVRNLTFEQGRLQRLTTGSYGSKQP